MNTHRFGSVRRELELLGTDVKTEVSEGKIIFNSETTNFGIKRKSLEDIAEYYHMKLISLNEKRGEMTDKAI